MEASGSHIYLKNYLVVLPTYHCHSSTGLLVPDSILQLLVYMLAEDDIMCNLPHIK